MADLNVYIGYYSWCECGWREDGFTKPGDAQAAFDAHTRFCACGEPVWAEGMCRECCNEAAETARIDFLTEGRYP